MLPFLSSTGHAPRSPFIDEVGLRNGDQEAATPFCKPALLFHHLVGDIPSEDE